MITNQVLLNTIEGLKSISRIDFCVFDGSKGAGKYIWRE